MPALIRKATPRTAAPASSSIRSVSVTFGMRSAQVRHVERAGDAVDQADADQEQQRGGEVDRDVVHARPDTKRTRAVQQQAVGCRQHHLEEDEEVEQVPGQESAVQPHEQELEQRVEMRARLRASAPGKDQRRRWPARPSAPASAPTGGRAPARSRRAAASCRADRPRPRSRPGVGAIAEKQDRRLRAAATVAATAPISLQRAPPLVEEQQQRAGDQRNQDRGDTTRCSGAGIIVRTPSRRHDRCRSGRARRAAPPGRVLSSQSR